jgi:molybdopterin/thiamine biosynthesis adenylyltransferase
VQSEEHPTGLRDEESSFRATILRDEHPEERRRLDDLRADPRITFIDDRDGLLENLRQLRPTPDPEVLAEATRWAYYPWRRAVVGVLGPLGFPALRLDRNRNLITMAEQRILGGLHIGVAGLSVGHAIAHALVAQGLCGTIRLADFDRLELSNLNRVPATVFDIGVNKAVVAARRIAELDPYQRVEVMTSGLTPEHLDDFLEDLDVVVEECDSLAMKVMVREAARSRGLPVLMATSDRGLIDVERFDSEPRRPVLHGLLGDVDSAYLAALPSRRDRIPYMLRHLDASRSSERLAASLVELDKTLSTWPQLAGDVLLGAVTVAEAVRRIGLGEPLQSGQVRIDVNRALDSIGTPRAPGDVASSEPANSESQDAGGPTGAVEIIAAAAVRAPSGGNAQPWTIHTTAQSVTLDIAAERTSMMDVAFRGSALAIGAAVFNARVAAATLGVLGPVTWVTQSHAPLGAVLHLGEGRDAELAVLYEPMLRRETNRHHGTPKQIDADLVAALHDSARGQGARLSLLTSRDDIERVATLFAAADRIRFLTPRLHAEMIAELRWPGDEPADSGLDVHSLELDPGGLAVLDILKRPDVMSMLAQWDTGEALGDDIRDRVLSSSAVAVITVDGDDLVDFARGGAAVEAVWVLAQQRGLAVQPISPVFLHAVHADELRDMSPAFADSLHQLQSDFRDVAATGSGEAQVLVLRLTHTDHPPSTVSRRRGLT